MGQKNSVYRVWVRNLKERYDLEKLGIDGRVILKWILKKRDWRACIGFT